MNAIFTKWRKTIAEGKQTPKIENLKSEEISKFIDLLLGKDSPLQVTEKLAGRHVEVKITEDGQIQGATKGKGKFFTLPPSLANPLQPLADQKQERDFSFEILEPNKRPDYVHYLIDKRVYADVSGTMTEDEASLLSNDDVVFLTKNHLVKRDFGLTEEQRQELKHIQQDLSQKLTVKEKKALANKIASIILSPNVKSVFGGAMEGFFVTGGSKDFKVPSPSYASVQKIQSPIYAVWTGRAGISKKEVRKRFLTGGYKDNIVRDVVRYFYAVMRGFPDGYKSFFSPEEAEMLLAMVKEPEERSSVYKIFSNRINDRNNWYVFGG